MYENVTIEGATIRGKLYVREDSIIKFLKQCGTKQEHIDLFIKAINKCRR